MRLLVLLLLLVLVIPGSPPGTPAIASAAEFTATPEAALPTWLPSRVTVETGELGSGLRYVRSTMIWDDPPAFPPHSTYEHDFFLDNYDESPLGSGTYLDRGENLLQQPDAAFWDSNLPSPYLDTRLAEPASTDNREVAFTIGSGNAVAIRAGTEYFTYIVIDAGDADIDSGRLTGQLGRQAPVGCTSTFCSFPEVIVPIFNAWDIPVPGRATYNVNHTPVRSTPVVQ